MKQNELSCTFCGRGTWSTWSVITNDGVIFACDWQHAEMSQAKIIRLERMKGKATWEPVSERRKALYEEFIDDFKQNYE
jgi:hypothetical protein